MPQIEEPPSHGKFPFGLVKDHLELALLEWGVEKQEGWRRLVRLGAGAILLFSSFVYFQLALIGWFLRRGFQWEGIGFILGVFYFASGVLVLWLFGKRQEGLGPPFQGSLAELKRSFRWIEKRFF